MPLKVAARLLRLLHCDVVQLTMNMNYIVYTQTLLHKEAFTHQCFYTQTLLHSDAFTHRCVYTQKLLHTDTFTHRSLYTQSRLHTETFTHRRVYRRFYTQTRLHRVTAEVVKSQFYFSFWRSNQRCRGTLKNRNFTLVFGARTSFRAKELRRARETCNVSAVFGDRTSFRAKGLPPRL